MPTRSGSIGSSGGWTNLQAAKSIGITMSANEYPKGTITFSGIGSGAFWYNGAGTQSETMAVYLCDSAGNNAYKLFDVTWNSEFTNSTTKTATGMNCPNLKGKALYIKGVLPRNPSYANLRGYSGVSVDTQYDSFSITCSASTGGSLRADKSSATPGDTVTLTPTANTGYYFTGYSSSPAVTISNNKFTMPSSAITVTANFAKIGYNITRVSNPSGGGTVTTSKSNATQGETINVSQTPNTGYYFTGWTTSPANLISGSSFTMPASAVTVTANYKRRSTASVNKTSVDGGGTLTMTISTESSAYTHKYQLSFGSGMAAAETSVAAGVTTVNISVPLSWSTAIPNATSKTGGTLTLKTYSGSTLIGTYTVTGLTYTVPASVKPTLGTVTTRIIRTIDGVTYADIGDFYTQSHCGVRIQGSASGDQGSTISSMTVTISGYSGSNYSKTVLTGSIDFTSGLLIIAGNTTITVTATDSRGRTSSTTVTIEVMAYSAPAGSLRVYRVDALGDVDDMGVYGRYELTKQYTQLGTNTLSWTLSYTGGTATSPPDSGDLLPGDRKNFSETLEYDFTLTLSDSLETVTITARLPSARFIIFVDSSGDKIGFMKVPNQPIPTGKQRTFEISADTQIYIGNQTLEDYIRSLT